MIDTWFSMFKVSINLNIFYSVNLVTLLILIKVSFTNFNYKEKIE
jgi:plasmid replication initiation protein